MLQCILDAVYEQRKGIEPKTFKESVSTLADVCLRYSECVDDSFRKVTKKDITDLVERLELMLTAAFKTDTSDPEQLYRTPELVHLNMALRCL